MKQAKILYVEDEMGAARLLKRNLELTGRYEVCVQNWPEDAVATARAFRPDLVLLDIIMPRMPGGNVVEEFAKDPELRDVPIVFFTAAVWPHQVEENDGIICDRPCLAKPADVDQVIAIIEKHLPQSCRSEAASDSPRCQSETNRSSRIRCKSLGKDLEPLRPG